jgi:hypothetical protein
MEAPLTILYTHHIRGELNMLPRMHTFIRRLRGELAEGRTFLVDLGDSCVPDVWPCAITEGRSTLIVLDAMGFHAANVTNLLSPVSRARLEPQVSLALVDETHPFIDDGIRFVASDVTRDTGTLTVQLSPAAAATLEEGVLRLPGLEHGQIGIARLSHERLVHEVHALPNDTPPEPTVSGAVDFVRDEARYYEKRQREKDEKGEE